MRIHLKCCKDSHKPIELQNGVSIILGRSPQTKITDKKCSRQQIELKANYHNGTVELTQLGPNPAIVDNEKLCKGSSKTLNVGDTIYFFEKEHPHIIVEEKSEEKTAQKRTIDSFFCNKSPENVPNKRQKIVETDSKQETDSEEKSVAEKLKALQGQSLSKAQNSLKPQVKIPVVSGEDKWVKSATPTGWSKEGYVLFYHPENLYDSSKIAAFDMDGTLITTASGKTFPKDASDWRILYSEVPGKLKKLHKDGYKIVIITNQLGIGKGKISVEEFQGKVQNILKKMGVPIQVIAITKKGIYRKPNIGSWTWLRDNGNGGIPINMVKSMYVGDAAGRPKDWAPKKKKDFSCGDRLFAINLGITFKTPEEYFLSQKPAKFDLPEFNPRELSFTAPVTENGEDIVSTEQEVIVMVGYPASGKSFFAKHYLVPEGYFHVNRDTMKTWQKCVSSCETALASGKSVVIDNTNPDMLSRKRYIDCAKRKGCKCRCFVMKTSMEHAKHNNSFRELSKSDHAHVPDMVFFQHRKSFVEPKEEEGFYQVVKINFIPKFDDDEMKHNYLMYND